MKTVDIFYQQFQLSINRYLDNNNFIRYNKVKTNDARYNFMAEEREFYFLDSIQFPQWTTNDGYMY